MFIKPYINVINYVSQNVLLFTVNSFKKQFILMFVIDNNNEFFIFL